MGMRISRNGRNGTHQFDPYTLNKTLAEKVNDLVSCSCQNQDEVVNFLDWTEDEILGLNRTSFVNLGLSDAVGEEIMLLCGIHKNALLYKKSRGSHNLQKPLADQIKELVLFRQKSSDTKLYLDFLEWPEMDMFNLTLENLTDRGLDNFLSEEIIHLCNVYRLKQERIQEQEVEVKEAIQEKELQVKEKKIQKEIIEVNEDRQQENAMEVKEEPSLDTDKVVPSLKDIELARSLRGDSSICG